MFADWTDRIAAGELPPAPPRPQGVERNVVITLWDWADPKAYLHDEVATDRRNPTAQRQRLLYGALELSTDYVPVLDPVRNTASQIQADRPRPEHAADAAPTMLQPSPYLGQRGHLEQQDQRAQPDVRRARAASGSRRPSGPPDNPAFCKEGSTHPSAKLFPIERSRPPARGLRSQDEEVHAHRHLLRHAPPDVRRGCQRYVVDERRRRRWSAGSTRRCSTRPATSRSRRAGPRSSSTPTATASATRMSSPNQPVDPAKDKRYRRRRSTPSRRHRDGSIWGTVLGFPGAVVRINPGSNPPETALAEVYELPFDNASRHSGLFAARRSISTATASSGPRSPADISPASTAASARAR